ncbi:alkaline phosphatase family protein [Lentibacillus cibarius]|uniref:Alkaline phosphatase family protein n=1 Tax=Lentibacillus cibarius TaxID=2583219 RepID=A0A5S3QL73_9BACI|nr:alkaline phosphatase family protein [Lentibacillus cibarius]TMN22615.1 alkaline phosphatase family protein [Lentibacillus cibarius]
MSTNKVILVVVDGMRNDTATRNLGYVHHLVEKNKAALYKVKSELPSLSRPLYEVILTGTPSFENGIVDNAVIRNSTKESLFHITKKNGLKNATASYYWVSELYNRSPFDVYEDREQEDESKPIQYGRFYFEDDYPDSHLIIDGEQLRRNFDPDFLYIHPMNVDYIGEIYGSESTEYHKRVLQTGKHLAQILPTWIEEGYQVLITADHGMSEHGTHGGTTEGERDVPLYVISPKVTPGVHDEEIPQLALAPFVCKLLDVDPSKEMISFEFPGLEE